MKFELFWRSLNAIEKRAFATRLQTSVAYLSHIAHGRRKPSTELSKKIFAESAGRVPLKKLRPDVWI